MPITKLPLTEFVQVPEEIEEFLLEADITTREGYLAYYLSSVAARLRTSSAIITQLMNGVIDDQTAANAIGQKIKELKQAANQLMKTGDKNYVSLIQQNISVLVKALSEKSKFTPVYPQNIDPNSPQISQMVQAELAQLKASQKPVVDNGPKAKVDHWVTAPTSINPQIDLAR